MGFEIPALKWVGCRYDREVFTAGGYYGWDVWRSDPRVERL